MKLVMIPIENQNAILVFVEILFLVVGYRLYVWLKSPQWKSLTLAIMAQLVAEGSLYLLQGVFLLLGQDKFASLIRGYNRLDYTMLAGIPVIAFFIIRDFRLAFRKKTVTRT